MPKARSEVASVPANATSPPKRASNTAAAPDSGASRKRSTSARSRSRFTPVRSRSSAIRRPPAPLRSVATTSAVMAGAGCRCSASSEDEERRHIGLAIASLQKTIGSRPLGWYCRYGPSVNTRRLLVEEGGFLYNFDAYNDDLPYWTVVQGKPHLIVPYSLCNNDSKFIRGNFATGQHFFEYMRDAIDVLRAEGATAPKMMSIGLHMRVIGQPARAAGLLRLLDHVKQYDDVWICPRIDIARHWRATHPFEAVS